MTRVAMCTCGAPLVSTFAFRHFEFYCLECGRRYGFLDPQGAPETPALIARMDAAEEEFRRLAEGLIAEGGRLLDDCDSCRAEDHMLHATPEELVAHEAALVRIRERIARVPA